MVPGRAAAGIRRDAEQGTIVAGSTSKFRREVVGDRGDSVFERSDERGQRLAVLL